MIIGIAAIPGCFDAGVSSLLDVLAAGEQLRRTVDPSIEPIEARLIGTSTRVRTGHGFTIPIDHPLEDPAMHDVSTVIAPGLGTATPATLGEALHSAPVRRLRRWLADAPGELQLAAACTGTFVLAADGALDGRRATAPWWLTGEFRRRHPRVTLDMTRMVVRSGRYTTAGAAFAHIDLALTLLSQQSPKLADAAARYLLVEARPTISLEAAAAHLAETDALVTGFEEWARANLDRDFTIATACAALGTTRRTLERRCRTRTNASPLSMVKRLRIERATHLRRTTSLSWDQIAQRVGYRHGATVRDLIAAR